MRYKKNIILTLEILISFLRNLIGHFTDKENILTLRFKNIISSYRIITLNSLILIFSLLNITLCSSNIFNNSNVSAIDYSSNVGIGFTFNPTLSISLSSNDLVIPNLVPGSTLDSNSINVSVTTNAAYGYTLSATVGDSTHNNSDLIHTNSTNIFSSIATDADLPSLTTDNTWGYNVSLDSGSTWSNYNGLSSSSTTLLDKDSNTSSSIDFRIGAKASSVQPSGTYTNTITFTAVTKPTPITLSEAYASEGKAMINGYYTMQDMTSTICEKTEAIGAQLQVLDIRDYKLYWISKLADNHCWMTQNLGLNLVANSTTLNSTNTDIDEKSYNPNSGAYSPTGGYSKNGNTDIITWSPIRNTISAEKLNNNTWVNDYNSPYSYSSNNIYYYDPNDSISHTFDSLSSCQAANYSNCDHYSAENYYNWSAAIASNDTTTFTEPKSNANNSICPKNWRLPQNNPTNDFNNLLIAYNITNSQALNLLLTPIWWALSGDVSNGAIGGQNGRARYWSSTIYNNAGAYRPSIMRNTLLISDYGWRGYGFSIRCLAR